MRIFHMLPIWNAQNVEKLDFLIIIGGQSMKNPSWQDDVILLQERWVYLNAPVARDTDSIVLLVRGLQMMMSLAIISTIKQRSVPTGKRLKKNQKIKMFDKKPKLTEPNEMGFQFGINETLTNYAKSEQPQWGGNALPPVDITVLEV